MTPVELGTPVNLALRHCLPAVGQLFALSQLHRGICEMTSSLVCHRWHSRQTIPPSLHCRDLKQNKMWPVRITVTAVASVLIVGTITLILHPWQVVEWTITSSHMQCKHSWWDLWLQTSRFRVQSPAMSWVEQLCGELYSPHCLWKGTLSHWSSLLKW